MTPDLADIETLRDQLQRFGVRPEKKLSQNFLVDREALEEIVSTADLEAADNVVEVGAGTGVLTVELAKRVQQVVAVEVDEKILPLLRETVREFSNVEVIAEDIRHVTIDALTKKFTSSRYKVVANLPYHLSGYFLERFLDTDHGPVSLTLLLQKEVAERAAAGPGEMSLLSISVQFFGTPQVTVIVPAEAFWPAPKVDSAILHIVRHPAPRWGPAIRANIFRLARIGFAGRRKTLANALAGGLGLPKPDIAKALAAAGIPPRARAQELTLEQWQGLAGRV